MDLFNFFLHQAAHNPQKQRKTSTKNFLPIYLKSKSEIAPLDMYSDLLFITLQRFCTPVFGQFLPFFLADPYKLNQIRWGLSVNCHLYIFQQMFYGVQVWVLAMDIQRLVLKPLWHCQAFMLQAIVMLKDDLSLALEMPHDVSYRPLCWPWIRKHVLNFLHLF